MSTPPLTLQILLRLHGLDGLQTYLILEQQEFAYSRQDGDWTLSELASSGSVHVPCLGRRLSLDDICADVPV